MELDKTKHAIKGQHLETKTASLVSDLIYAHARVYELEMSVKKLCSCQQPITQPIFDKVVPSNCADNNNVKLWPECWAFVFDELNDDAASTEACYNTCLDWRSQLAAKRPNFLFTKVLPILSPYLDKETILLCRSVSTMWKEAVDATCNAIVHQSHLDTFESRSNADITIHPLAGSLINDYNFTSFPKMEKFILTVGNIGRRSTPIIPKCLRLGDEFQDTAAESVLLWLGIATRFLPMFGNQITYCKLQFSYNIGARLLHIIIISVLRHMPNLTHLTIHNFSEVDYSVSDFDEFIDGFGVLFDYQPCLNRLVSLEISKVSYETLSLLTQYRLEKLTVIILGRYEFPVLTLQGLKTLSTIVTTWIVDALHHCSIDCLTKLQVQAISLHDLPRLTILFKNTLEIFKLVLLVCANQGFFTLRLRLPRLHTLHLEVPINTLCYDFLLSLTSLKHLKIVKSSDYMFNCNDQFDESLSILQIHGFYDHLYDSNIWSLLPALTCVEIRDDVLQSVWSYDRKCLVVL